MHDPEVLADCANKAAMETARVIREAQLKMTLDNAKDVDILHQVELRGLYPCVSDDDLIELVEAVKVGDLESLIATVRRLSWRHLGILI